MCGVSLCSIRRDCNSAELQLNSLRRDFKYLRRDCNSPCVRSGETSIQLCISGAKEHFWAPACIRSVEAGVSAIAHKRTPARRGGGVCGCGAGVGALDHTHSLSPKKTHDAARGLLLRLRRAHFHLRQLSQVLVQPPPSPPPPLLVPIRCHSPRHLRALPVTRTLPPPPPSSRPRVLSKSPSAAASMPLASVLRVMGNPYA